MSIEADKGLSAKNMDRPGLQRCVRAIEAGDVDIMVIYKLDRLTRSVVDLNTIVELLEKHSVALVSIQESLDATSPTGQLMMNLLASVSQWERQVIGERTKDALRYLREQGKVYSAPVYGYDVKRGRMVANPDEQAVIEQVRAWRDGGLSYQGIAVMLNEQGIPAKKGGVWLRMTVQRLVCRVG